MEQQQLAFYSPSHRRPFGLKISAFAPTHRQAAPRATPHAPLARWAAWTGVCVNCGEQNLRLSQTLACVLLASKNAA